MAGPSVTFVAGAFDDELAKALASAEAFIFPGVDDFGIAAVEALAAGTPVIAYKAGGALDYVVEGKTGEFFTEPTVESLVACLQSFQSNKFDEATIKNTAKEFSGELFSTRMNELILKSQKP